MNHNWLTGLNPEQIEAVEHNYGPLLILAGAGSGKTTVLVARAGRLVDEKIVAAANLCVLTFTNKAARELKTRVAAKLGSKAKGLWAGTFHSFGLTLLRQFHKEAGLIKDFGVMNPGDSSALVKDLLKDFNNGKTNYDAEKILARMSDWREVGRTKAEKDDEYEEAVEWVMPKLLRSYESLGMVDFDGLILKPIELMEQHEAIRREMQEQFQQLMVDEFQDTNKTQMKLIKLLGSEHRNVAVVGDDDQSIYGWRGACIQNILDFPKLNAPCKVVRLERNYRSTPAILKIANAVIAKNERRHDKKLRSRDDAELGERPETLVCESENEEIEQIALEVNELIRNGFAKKDIAVLYRSNGQGALLEAELRRQGIPYLMSGGTAFFDRRETRDILAYLRCAIRPNEIAFRRILNVPPRGVGEKTVDELTQVSADRHRPFVWVARHWQETGIEERAGAGIDELFLKLHDLLPFVLQEGDGTCGERMLRYFDQIGYKKFIEKASPNALVASNKWKLVEVFSRILDRFIERGARNAQTIREFIDAMELRDQLNENKEDEDRVQLLTLHACKGLEFPAVIMMGMEEDIIPHKTLGSDLAEERRLFYVGVTRAKQKLLFTRSKKRQRHGKVNDSAPSRFLVEIPAELVRERTGEREFSNERRRAMLDALYAKLETN